MVDLKIFVTLSGENICWGSENLRLISKSSQFFAINIAERRCHAICCWLHSGT